MDELLEEKQLRREFNRNQMALQRLENRAIKRTMQIMSQIPGFAQDTDEREWQIIGNPNMKQPLTMQQLTSIRQSARQLQYYPAGRNILQTYQDFIIGKDATITTNDEDVEGEVQDYWDEWELVNTWDEKTKEIIKRLYRDGEVFLRWFQPDDKHLLVRFIDPSQITPTRNGRPSYGISVDSNDYEKVLVYNRQWTSPNGQMFSEKIPADEVDHWKIGVDSDVKRGVSIFYGVGKYIRDHRNWLDDRIAINRIRHIWNVIGEPTSGVASISDMKNKFDDVSYKRNSTSSTATDTKKVPKPGSVIMSKGVKWKLDSLNINAADTKDDGRAIQLQIAVGTNLPEYIVRGDASNANYSSSMVSESPFVRAMESAQDLVAKIFEKAYTRVIEWGISQNDVPAKSVETETTFDPNTGEDVVKTEDVDTDTTCSVNFATLIHRDIKAETEALQIQIGEEIVSVETSQEKLGYDSETENNRIAREKHQRMEDQKAAENMFNDDDHGGDNDGDD